MTVSTTSGRVAYSGDGSTQVFTVPYYFLADEDLGVYLLASGVQTKMALAVDYTVSGAGDEDGGSVTMLSAPAGGATLTILREPQFTQETDYQANDPFPAETHERALDKGVMIDQFLQDQLDRSVRFNESTSPGGELSGEPLKLFGTDASGSLTEYDLTDDPGDYDIVFPINADKSFRNVASMVADETIKVGDYVRTLGYLTPGDGGGNVYEVVVSGTGTADAGSFIDLTGVAGQARGLFPNGVHAAQFGAGLGNDDTAAITALVNYANEREIVFQPGDYNIPYPDGYDVYLAVGSGNMSGENSGPVDSGGLDAPDARVLQYAMSGASSGSVILAEQPMAYPNPQTGVSPAMRFAIEGPLTETPANRSIIIVPAAVAGSGSADWQPGQSNYIAAVNAANAAMAEGTGTNVFRGIICTPFGADEGVLTGPQYEANIQGMINGFRADVTGAAEARFLTIPFIPEFSGSGGDIDQVHIGIHAVTKRAAAANVLGTGNQESGHLTTAVGARETGRRMGDAILDITGRRWFLDFLDFSGLDPRPQVLLQRNVDFLEQRPLGVLFTYEQGPERVNADQPDAARGHRILIEDNNEYPAADAIYQWWAFPEGTTDAWAETFFTISADWKDGQNGRPQTTFQAYATGVPGHQGFVSAIGGYTAILGDQGGWAGVFVVTDGRRVDKPEGVPEHLTGVEIDMQPSVGSTVSNGSGLLVNNFRAPAPGAGVAIVANDPGYWPTGIFLGNIQGTGIRFDGAFAGTVGIDLSFGTYSDVAINMGIGRDIRFTGGGTTTEITRACRRQVRHDLGRFAEHRENRGS